MAALGHADHAPGADGERPMPPIQQIGAATLIVVVIGGIYTAAHLPQHVPQGPAIGLLAAAAVLLAVNIVLLSRIENFAWRSFRLVAGWVLAAYIVIAGMLEYVFIYDDTRGTQLVILTLMLVVFAIDIPLLLGFSVARFQDADS
jgi:drug/metabolite transporter (DMT)-like permease